MGLHENVYNRLVRKNENVCREYEQYVISHVDEHYKKRIKHWIVLARLKYHYEILNRTEPLLKTETENSVIFDRQQNELETKVEIKTKTEQKHKKSNIFQREEVLPFVNNLMKYDVISFDIFDTLIFRPFNNPRDLFFVIGKKLNVLNFRKIRMDAENVVRKEAMLKYNNHEVSLSDIWKHIERETGIDATKGMQVEIDTELELCYANPYMLRVFRLLKSQKKKIIAVSDMYLPENIIIKLLEKNGYVGVEKVFVSCDYCANKRGGALYKTVKQICGEDKTYIHVGDNWDSDYQSAKNNDIDAKYYKNVNEIGKSHRAVGMSDLIGSAYAGIVNAWLYSGLGKYSPAYEYGFVYGGIYILGYCNWIHKKVKKEGIDKVIFLSRDGDIYQRIYKMMFPEDNNIEYFYWSRIANIKATVENMRANFLSSTIKNKAADKMDMSAASMLESLDLGRLVSYLTEYKLRPETVITWDNYLVLQEMLIDHWDEVVEIYETYNEATELVLKEKIGKAKKVAVVDVGWTGTGPLGIKQLVEEKWNWPVEVVCLVAASRVWAHVSNITQITEEIVEPYMFSRQYNRNLYDTHVRTNNNTNNIYFEFFTQATYPSFGGYNIKNGVLECMFDVPEIENYEFIREIHRGVEEFCKEYMKRFENETWMYNISGYDAYVPYRHAILNMNFIKKHFKDFKFARGISSDVNNQRLESMKDIWDKVGIKY